MPPLMRALQHLLITVLILVSVGLVTNLRSSGSSGRFSCQPSIVAIHGLNGDREASWTASGNNILWLRDLLAPGIPNARILTYGYDANTSGAWSTHQTVPRHADDLLAKLAIYRELTNTIERPIVFVVHSLGGIVLKQALVHAFSASPNHLSGHKAIQVSTSGIIFLGTPHQGANGVTLASIVLRIQSFYSSTNDGILKHLGRDSEFLEVQQTHYTSISERIDTKFFYEAYATRLPGGRQITLVPRISAVVPGTRDAEAIAINKDHSGMSKFASHEDDDFRTVLQSLRSMVKQAPQKVRREWVQYKRIETPSRRFTGRADQLNQLQHLFFDQRDEVQQRVLLHGMAGVGKTQIALKFAEQNAGRLWRVFWVDANNTETIEESLRAIAIDDPEAQGSKVRESPQSVLRWISRADGEWLMVFDNADRDSSLVVKYLPSGNRGNVLITSLTPEMGHVVSHFIEVQGMEKDDADSLLLTAARLNLESGILRREARAIVTELCFLPLAVDQAGTAIARGLVDIDGYLAMYANHRQRLMAYPSFKGATNYGRAVYGTWDMLFEAINSQRATSDSAKSAIVILETFAFLHPENIREDIFQRAAESSFKDPANLPFPLTLDKHNKWDPLFFNEGIEILLSYSLIRRGGVRRSYAVHRLVHNWSRDRMELIDQVNKCIAAKRILVRSISLGDTSQEYAFRRAILPHIKANRLYALEANAPRSFDDDEFNKYWRVYFDNGYGKDAEDMISRAVEWRAATYGPEDPRTFDSQDRLVVAYHLLEEWDKAEKLGVALVEGRKRVMGPEHVSTLGTMSNLALTYKSQRKPREAEKLGLEVLRINTKILGPEHPDLLPTMNNLASTYADLEQWQDGEPLALRAIEMTKSTVGADHPRTVIRKLVLLRIYIGQGRLDVAEELALEILGMSEELYGLDNPMTLMCMSYLGMVYFHQRNTAKAVEVIEQALTIGQAVLEPDHPDLLRFQVNLEHLRRQKTEDVVGTAGEDSKDEFVYRRWNT
ncbi:hypothetical protein D9615_009492 [Tricholomella constricta]|uniref:Uncharacterized protein n=1 Tax=Tricholomella constricta TaxID=117010 RepID=A0A8H5GYN1_9AGAR|nr:hypothetical protein D9615_009492 [Tricholomella constricta]